MASDNRSSRVMSRAGGSKGQKSRPQSPRSPRAAGRSRSSSRSSAKRGQPFTPVIPGYFIVEHSDNETFPVNSNCICKLIYEYIRVKVGIPDDLEFDLCDDGGNPVDLYDKEEGSYAYNHFQHKKKYYIFLLERGKNGLLFNPRLILNANDPNFQRLMKELLKIFSRLSTDRKKKKKPLPQRDLPYNHRHHKAIF